MMSAAVSRRAQELAGLRVPFVTATVVRAQAPTSALAGNVALVLGDGTVEGFVGGVCAEQSVRAYALQAIGAEEAVLLRILPEAAQGEAGGADGLGSEAGAVTVQNPCLSGGAIEVFLEPVLPGPRVMVVGETPIAGAILALGAALGLDVATVDVTTFDPGGGDLALVVASHGRDELATLQRALDAGVPYVGLVASRKRGASVIAELRADGVPADLVALIDVPAGIDIGARTPAEIALSILASIIAVRREQGQPLPRPARGERPGFRAPPAAADSAAADSATPTLAVDPVCGMTVAALPVTLSVEHDGETVYFCGEGCQAKFEAQHAHATVAD